MPTVFSKVSVYAADIVEHAASLGMNQKKSSHEIVLVLHSLIDVNFEDLCSHAASDDPLMFWGHFLGYKTVAWQPEIRRLIQKVLVIPLSTADVERGFSILSHTKYDRRNRLSDENLRNILFLHVNGPEPGKFDSIRYARQ